MSRKIVILLGSVRSDSNSAKVAQLIVDELGVKGGAMVDLVDPRAMQLVIPETAGQEEACKALEDDLRKRVLAAEGVMLVTPEYDGSYSAVMKVLLEYLGYPSVLAGKPVAIVGAASGRIGAARAVDHLRALCLHVGSLVLPRSPSLAGVHRMFDDAGRCVDAEAEAKVRGAARKLLEFLERLGV